MKPSVGLIRISRSLLRSSRFVPSVYKKTTNSICYSVKPRVSYNALHIQFKSHSAMASQDINIDQLKELQKDSHVLIVDVREPKEIQETGILPGAINIPLGEVQGALSKTSEDFENNYGRPKPKADTKIVFSCRSGRRSLTALETAKGLGYTNLLNFGGGWLEWEKHLPKN